MFYLPLDKLLDRGNTRSESDTAAPADSNTGSTTLPNKDVDSVTVEARGRGDR